MLQVLNNDRRSTGEGVSLSVGGSSGQQSRDETQEMYSSGGAAVVWKWEDSTVCRKWKGSGAASDASLGDGDDLRPS